MINLYPHQYKGLKRLRTYNRCAFYWDMGLGKTHTGSEKLHELGGKINLVVCQKSKLQDWLEHFRLYYDYPVADLTKKAELEDFLTVPGEWVGVINYDLIFRRPALLRFPIDTLLLDESSIIQNENAKRSKAILKMNVENVILLSGTPTGGKYERLWSQCQLLGWDISKDLFYKQYVEFEWVEEDGFWRQKIIGYKNVDRLKRKLAIYGADFLKTEEVLDLPEQTFIPVLVPDTKEYRKFRKTRYLEIDGRELIGDTTLTAMLYERQLCGQYCNAKLEAFKDLLESTNDRLIVFYNFTAEKDTLGAICDQLERPWGLVNGEEKNLAPYETQPDSVTFVQYQAGAMGLNLQKANKIIYFSPPLSCELWMQSKKRIHRIGQDQPCFYYQLICKNSVEERIYRALDRGEDYTDKLFEKNS